MKYVASSLLGVGVGIFPNSPAILGILKYKIIVLKIKDDNVKNLDFLKTLVEDGLETTLPKPVEDWVEENFDAKWKEEFLSDIKVLKDELMKSPYYPSHKYMLLLKYIFLLQQGY